MSSWNKVQLMGRLGQDPETRRQQSGDAIVTMRLATSETWRDKATGEKRERTEWHTVVIFNQSIAKIAEQYVRKGHLVFVEGMLCTRQWEDQSGNKRYATEVVLKAFQGEMKLMPNGNGNQRSQDDYGQQQTRQSQQNTGSYADQSGSTADLDDEIPF